MSERYKAFDAEAPYFITFTMVEWIPLLEISEFATILIDSLKFCVRNKGLSIYGYCIMPSHVHLIVQSHKNPLGSTFRDLKKFTSSEIIRIIKSNEKYSEHLITFHDRAELIKRNKYVKVWLDGYHPEIIYSNKFFFQKLNYIHNNPVVAGLVSVPEDYYYSSARNYAGLDAPLEIIFESQELNRIR
jgi:REP element-mobilizing transposase RayT